MSILVWKPLDVRTVRSTLGLTQPDIAKVLDISKQTISLLENQKHYSIPVLISVSVVLEQHLKMSDCSQRIKDALFSIRIPLESERSAQND